DTYTCPGGRNGNPEYSGLTMNVLKEYLRMLASLFLAIFDLIRSVSEVCDGIIFPGIQMLFRNRLSLKPL
ncbi:MAG TPA: hypothetical protein DEH15_12395, partial [Marinilabiliales bacterium]|nr:hypothetical protein [Marinilabiliales bacterium]